MEIRKQILGHKETRFIAAGTVVAKKAFLFENPPELWTAGERPRFEILTRVSLAVTASYKDKLSGTIDFWSTCGQLDREDWQDGKPKGCLISTGVVFEPGDEVIVAIQDHKYLPDGSPALRLRGGRRGASFTNTANDMEKVAAKAIHDFVENTFERF